MPDASMTIAGNLADDPDIQFSQAGTPWARFTVIVNERKEQNGQWVEVAKNGMRVVAFRDLAENLAQSLSKGDRVLVTGRLVPQQWQDRQSGENRYGWELNAEDVGPSLRWATARPEKARRGQNGGGGGGYSSGPGNGGQGGYGAQQGSGYGQSQGGAQPSELGYGPQGGGYDDLSDPPF